MASVCFHMCCRNRAEGLFNVLGGMGPVSDEKWGDKLCVIIDEDQKECREEMYRYG